MRQDQVLDLEHELRGHSGNLARGVAQHAGADHDVADQVALDRVVGRRRRTTARAACRCRAAARRQSGDRACAPYWSARNSDDLHDLEDVLEQAAAIGVMDLARGRPDAQPIGVLRRRCACSSARSAGSLTLASRPIAPPTSRRPAAARSGCSPLRGSRRPRPVGHHAPDLVEDDLESGPDTGCRGPAPSTNSPASNSQLQRVDVLKDLGADLPGDVLQHELQDTRCPCGPIAPSLRAHRKKPQPLALAVRSRQCVEVVPSDQPAVYVAASRKLNGPAVQPLAAIDGQHFAGDVRRVRRTRNVTASAISSARPHRPSGTPCGDRARPRRPTTTAAAPRLPIRSGPARRR